MAEDTAGTRIRHFRERAGMSRAVLGGLVGRSTEWVKAVETGRLQTPRLPMLMQLARVLDVDNVADLTPQHLATVGCSKTVDSQLATVTESLTLYQLKPSAATPVAAVELRRRVEQAWNLWHGTLHHRTAVAAVLPRLLRDAQDASRLLDDERDRRVALRLLAETYHLIQLYLSFQPVPHLVALTGDRGMHAAQDADDPHAIAVAAWYLNHVWRDAGEANEARVEIAQQAAALLHPEASRDDLVRWGLLQLACALSYAKIGRAGQAWHYWDEANRAARHLNRFTHPYLIFGQGMVDAYAVTMHADLVNAGRALHSANKLDLSAMPSATRRGFHHIEIARAHALRKDSLATVRLLEQAYQQAPDTARYNLFTLDWLAEHSHDRDRTVATSARRLAGLIKRDSR